LAGQAARAQRLRKSGGAGSKVLIIRVLKISHPDIQFTASLLFKRYNRLLISDEELKN